MQIINHGKLVFAETMATLNERLTGKTLTLETALPYDTEVLSAVDAVDSVEVLSDTRCKLHFSDANPAGPVAEQVIAAGWGLIELALHRQSLEQVFVELTCSETRNTSGAAA